MGRFAALALVALVVLASGVLPAVAEDESEVDATSIHVPPLDLAARIRSASPSGQGHLTVDVSVLEFIALQRLAQEDRQRLLGLAPSCRTRMTATSTASAPTNRLLILIACSQ